MRRRWLTAAWVALLLGMARGPARSAAQATGTVAGVVTVRDHEPGPPPPRYYRGQYRAAHVPPGGGDRPAAGRSVVVYINGAPTPPGGWPRPSRRPEMSQYHDRFEPHVLPVLRGTTVTFPNRDNHYHNVFSVVAGERFDLGRYGEGDTRLQTFDDPAVVVVRCEIHAGMKAYILVRDNPFFAVPDEAGRFHLEDVPAGTWTAVAWHPTQGEQRRTIVVPAGGNTVLDITF